MRFSKLSRRLLCLSTIVVLADCDISTSIKGPSCLEDCVSGFTYPQPQASLTPSPVAGGLSFKAISLGWSHLCGVTTAGDAYCWGAIDLGSQTFHIAKSPERVPGNIKFDTISVGSAAACGITSDKRTMCWGLNDVGQLGNGLYGPNVSVPTAVLSSVAFKSIAVGGWDISAPTGNVRSAFACGITAAGAAHCWGSDNLGQLGSGVATPNVVHVSPSPVAGGRTFTALAGNGFATTCGLETSGAAHCWGSNAYAEFGTATAEAGSFPPTRVASNLTFVALSTEGGTCGITTKGDTYCWGSSSIVGGSPLTPRLITSIPFKSIVAGTSHACGLTASGLAYCWGSNSSGQLGDGTRTPTWVPVLVATDIRFVKIAAGNDETCGLTATGAAFCWGSDGFYSMLGRGI